MRLRHIYLIQKLLKVCLNKWQYIDQNNGFISRDYQKCCKIEIIDQLIEVHKMNLDFILFSPPKVKYSFMDVWGQAIFIPSYCSSNNQPKKSFFSFVNCYNSTKTNEVYFTIENALNQNQGIISQQQLTAHTEEHHLEEQISHYIPALYLNSMVNSKYLLLYFHSSGEDMKLAHGLLNFIRNSYQINVIAMEYCGYSIYKGSSDSQIINQDAKTVYQFCIKELGFEENNIIVMGRSIGTGVALQLLSNQKQTHNYKPRCLVLISPFTSVKALAKQHAGSFGKMLVKEKYENLEAIASIKCPMFVLHGKKDKLIPAEHSQELLKRYEGKRKLVLPQNMTHTAFDYYEDLIDPLRQFLLEEGINFYEQNMKGPTIPENLFECPEGFKI